MCETKQYKPQLLLTFGPANFDAALAAAFTNPAFTEADAEIAEDISYDIVDSTSTDWEIRDE